MLLINTDERCRAQHEAVRNTAGWYYFTHHLIEVTGTDACRLLDRVYVSNIAKLAPTRGRYTMMLTEDGIPQDDCVIFCLEENRYWISNLHPPRTLRELEEHSEGLDVSFRKITKEVDMYAVQGPNACAMVESLADKNPSAQKRFQIVDNRIGDLEVKIAKGGYTGEAGYEIYIKPSECEKLETILAEAAPKFDAVKVDEFDVMAYTLATEAGLYLVTDIDEADPFVSGLEWMIDWSKEDFLGKAAVSKAKEEPRTKELIGFTIDKPFVKAHGGPYGAQIAKNGEVLGHCTKFTYGFTVGKWIGFALVKAGKVKTGDQILVDYEDAVVTERPFYKKTN
ncbi:MAG: aminomethyltransferase family protein [Eubacteriales bacterium]|nr:aminomethyltransferase family protein [Eubacteriales bacterium]